nr:hypothetical protein [uncultured Fretibacterium sp.]
MTGRGRGFLLVEVLTALVVGSVVGAIVLAAGRWFVLSSERVSRLLLARDRGERVLSYLEPRVLHAGLGLSSCRTGSLLRRAFGYGSSGAPLVATWTDRSRPLQVYKTLGGASPEPAGDEGGVFRGSGLCLLYAVPSGIVLGTAGGGPVSLDPGEGARFSVLSGSLGDWGSTASAVGRSRDLRSWVSLPLTGYPFFIEGHSGAEVSLELAAGVPGPVEVPPINDLFLMRGERFGVINGTLCFQELRTAWYPPYFQPLEDGVLALWFEWRPALKCLDLWVLTSGGPAVFGPVPRPPSWPGEAPWRSVFSRHELHVSRASWRAENL